MVKATDCFKNYFMAVLHEKDYVTGLFHDREFVTEIIISLNYIEINNYEKALDGIGWHLLSERTIDKKNNKLYNSILSTFINWCFKDFNLFADILLTGKGEHFK